MHRKDNCVCACEYLISSSLMRLSVLRRRLSVFVCYVVLEFVCHRVVVFVVFAAFVLADIRLIIKGFRGQGSCMMNIVVFEVRSSFRRIG
jgi:hypothetical protein